MPQRCLILFYIIFYLLLSVAEATIIPKCISKTWKCNAAGMRCAPAESRYQHSRLRNLDGTCHPRVTRAVAKPSSLRAPFRSDKKNELVTRTSSCRRNAVRKVRIVNSTYARVSFAERESLFYWYYWVRLTSAFCLRKRPHTTKHSLALCYCIFNCVKKLYSKVES